MASLSEVIDVLVHDDGASDDGVRADEGHQVVGDGHVHFAVRTSLHVAEVSNVAVLVSGRAVSLAERVEVRTSRRAAVGQIAELDNNKQEKGSERMDGGRRPALVSHESSRVAASPRAASRSASRSTCCSCFV